MSRSTLRRIGAALCAAIAAVYVMIGTEVIAVGDMADGGDIGVFGFGAAAIFVVGMVLLLRTDRRVAWWLGAAMLVMINVMYLAVAADRTPSFEAWGVGLRLPQVALIVVLVTLATGRSSERTERTVDPAVVQDFLAQRRIAVVGASDEPSNFGGTVYGELRDHGYEVVAVHPTAPTVRGDGAYSSLDEVPGPVDGVVVMVPRSAAVEVVRQAVARGIPRVWLFRGAGAGAVSHDAIREAERAGAAVVPGACPLMFLPPVGGIHRIHRGVRHLTGSLG